MAKAFGGSSSDAANTIYQTADGGYIVAGSSLSTNSGTLSGFNSNGNEDDWIIKLDASGNLQWQKLLGGSSADRVYSVQQTADGGYILAGLSWSSNTGTLTGINSNGDNDAWIIKLDAAGNLQWQQLLGGSSVDHVYAVQQTADAGYILAGSSSSSVTQAHYPAPSQMAVLIIGS
jgi:hypothetical protein